VQQNVLSSGTHVTINGQSKHILGYLQDFLFSPERARSPVSILSGGERNRLLLSKLFTKPFNVLVMDEPTNDLDVETLDLLEDLLLEYSGTLLLVSHDREFLNNVVTSTLVVGTDGLVREFVGGYDDWLRQSASETVPAAIAARPVAEKPRRQAERPRKMTFKEERELESMPDTIARLEEEQQQLHTTLADPEFYKSAGAQIVTINTRLEALEQELELAFQRWEELEALK